jgi:hypothetical protein
MKNARIVLFACGLAAIYMRLIKVFAARQRGTAARAQFVSYCERELGKKSERRNEPLIVGGAASCSPAIVLILLGRELALVGHAECDRVCGRQLTCGWSPAQAPHVPNTTRIRTCIFMYICKSRGRSGTRISSLGACHAAQWN